jgi:hypothetical protein
MNELEKILWFCWLNKFIYKLKWLIKNIYKKNKNIIIIQLNLEIKEISYINNNFDAFVNILNLILKTFNNYFTIKYNNITYSDVYVWENILKNCIVFYNSNNIKENWFLISKTPIKISKTEKEKDIVDKIFDLIMNKNLSVRNLIKIWIFQIKARKIYKFLKEKEIFFIDENNQNEKIYNFENLKNISKSDINDFLK